MKETKDDNWSDWLINDKLRWERFGSFGWKERVSMWTGIVLGSLLFIAILVVAFLILKMGNKLYSYTLMPFSELPINHTVFCIILDAILSLIIIVSKKRWRRGNNRVTMFFLLMFFNPVLCYFLFGFVSFAILYPNSNYGNKEIITQRAIFTGKVFRVAKGESIVCYNFYGSSDISSDTAVMQCIKSQSKVFLVPKSIGISFHYFNLVINTFNFSR